MFEKVAIPKVQRKAAPEVGVLLQPEVHRQPKASVQVLIPALAEGKFGKVHRDKVLSQPEAAEPKSAVALRAIIVHPEILESRWKVIAIFIELTVPTKGIRLLTITGEVTKHGIPHIVRMK